MTIRSNLDSSLDNPVERFEDDAFNRRPFSERLAATIATLPSENGSPVLGLYGRWGYGKSTVLNFVQLALKEQAPEGFVIYSFNPWLMRDQTALIQDFFAGLANAFEVAIGRKGGKVGKAAARYGGAISLVPVIGGALAAILKGVGEQLSEDTIAHQRNRLVDAMRDAKKKVVVLIDDLDRLDRDEVMAMLKLVRLSANFPNVIYLLAFDESRIARLAATASGAAADDGRQFLEKIVQYPYTLPAVGEKRLTHYVTKQVESAFKARRLSSARRAGPTFGRCAVMRCSPLSLRRDKRFAMPMLCASHSHFSKARSIPSIR